jgi:FtsP/CotA-like multicopper oxidase with cupredoxin domain
VIAPSERVVIDVLFEQPGPVTLEHRTPRRTYSLATIDVSDEPATPALVPQFDVLRHNPEWVSERERVAPYFDAPPDKTLALVAEMNIGDAAGGYACPMHPEVTSDEPGKCPKCGMKLLPAELVAQASGHGHHSHGHGHSSGHHAHHGGHGDDGQAVGIEWEDDMVDVNRLTTSANTRWNVVDRETGAVGHAIDWQFRVGDQVKVRLVNEMESDHPMHHPFHIHGAGRFVVLARNGEPERNLLWKDTVLKDTVLVRAGETVDILLDVTNPGVWMAHCHIAEHHESGMMFSFTVAP